jgi:hypothetical protein
MSWTLFAQICILMVLGTLCVAVVADFVRGKGTQSK